MTAAEARRVTGAALVKAVDLQRIFVAISAAAAAGEDVTRYSQPTMRGVGCNWQAEHYRLAGRDLAALGYCVGLHMLNMDRHLSISWADGSKPGFIEYQPEYTRNERD